MVSSGEKMVDTRGDEGGTTGGHGTKGRSGE